MRTFPLDEDALTLSDLFELRQTITNLLLTPGSDGEAERQEEARGLIRGILHAAQGLQASLPTAASTSTLAPDAEAHLDALGLLSPLAPSKLAFLQAFALHEMSSILPPPLSAVDVSSVATGSDGPSKKRKVDPSEPTSAGEWLELAAIKYEKARESLPGPGAWATMIAIESTRVFMERAVISLLSDRTGEEGKSLVEQTIQKFLATCGLLETAPVPDTDDEDAPDVPAALLRLLAIYIPFIDDFAEPPHFTLMTNIAVLGLVTTCLDSPVLAGEATPLRQIDIAIINADLRMTIFSQCEVAVTDKYRQVVEEEEEAEDDEAVVPLPDSEDVRQARAAGKTGQSCRSALSHALIRCRSNRCVGGVDQAVRCGTSCRAIKIVAAISVSQGEAACTQSAPRADNRDRFSCKKHSSLSKCCSTKRTRKSWNGVPQEESE